MGSGGFAHFAEYLSWLMGYETLCVSLFEQRDLVAAISQRLVDLYREFLERLLQFDRVKIIWGSDDMGFKGGTLISPDDLREFVLPGHKLMAEMSHAAGRPYLLHSCGDLSAIMDDLIDDVGIDAKHSFEDTIELVTEVKDTYGQRTALLGRDRCGLPVPLGRGRSAPAGCVRRLRRARPVRATCWARGTASPTTSR